MKRLPFTAALALTACLGPLAPLPPHSPAQGSAPGGPAEDPEQREPAPTTAPPSPVAPAPTASEGSSFERLIPLLRRMLAERDLAGLADHAHPTKGVRFSPYAFVSEGDVTLSADELRSAATRPKVRTWGSYDGSGHPIRYTFSQYFDRFVAIPDPSRAQVGVDRQLGSGNTPSNLTERYPGARFIELHHPGSDPKYDGMDWQSVRFVFESIEDGWRLVGVIHDQWTI